MNNIHTYILVNYYRHLFPTFTKDDDNTTSVVETLKKVLNNTKDKPFYDMLEELFFNID